MIPFNEIKRTGQQLGLILLMSIVVASCAGPRYEVVYDFSRPTDARGLQCIDSCSATQQLCREKCNETKSQCFVDADALSKLKYKEQMARYQRALDSYPQQLKTYYSKLELYKSQQRQFQDERDHYAKWCQKDPKDEFACDKQDELDKRLKHLVKPIQPGEPKEPLLSALVELEYKACNTSCGHCESQFRNCYSACGGKVTMRRVCTANCEK